MSRTLLSAFAILTALFSSPAAACSVHDQNCRFQGLNQVYNPNITANTPTEITIGTVSNNNVDFDNNVLLPDGNGPYITSQTVPVVDPGQPYLAPDQQPRHLYPGQQQIDFNNNLTQAKHSGDNLPASSGGVPGGNNCVPGVVAGTSCESVAITGPIPATASTPFVVNQTDYLYNQDQKPDPTTTLTSYATASGNAFLIHNQQETPTKNSYISINEPETLTQSKETGKEYTYTFGYRNFNPHAVGAPVYYDLTAGKTPYGQPYVNDHRNGLTQVTYQPYTQTTTRNYILYDGTTGTDAPVIMTGLNEIGRVERLGPVQQMAFQPPALGGLSFGESFATANSTVPILADLSTTTNNNPYRIVDDGDHKVAQKPQLVFQYAPEFIALKVANSMLQLPKKPSYSFKNCNNNEYESFPSSKTEIISSSLKYAELSQQSYNNLPLDITNFRLADLSQYISGFSPVISLESGLYAYIYEQETFENGEYIVDLVVAFRGTNFSTMDDIRADLQQIIGGGGLETRQYNEAAKVVSDVSFAAEKIRREVGNVRITLTGHSLGGGLAQYAAVMSPTPVDKVVTFNSAGLSELTLLQMGENRIKKTENSSKIYHIRSTLDPISPFGNHLSGCQVIIEVGGLNKHGIKNIISAIGEYN